MKSLMFTGIAAAALIAAAPAAFASDSFAGPSSSALETQIEGTVFGTKAMSRMSGHRPHAGRAMRTGRMMRGVRGRSYGAYRRPSYGYILPTFWRAPSFGISNFAVFGLSAPSSGYYWSRYYDDAVLRNNAGSVYDYRQNIDWSRGGNGYAPNGYYNQAQQPVVSGPAIQADPGVYGVANAYNAPAPTGEAKRGVYDGEWTGEYIDEESRTYRGEWQGQYTNDQGQVYQGTYRGTSVGDPVYTRVGAPTPAPAPVAAPQQYVPAPVAQPRYAPSAPAQTYRTPGGYESYERCLKGRGVKGGVIGAVVGAVAGNRIAGRGSRLEGSLIGGGIGALAGLGIEKALDKCERFLPLPQQQRAPAPQNYRPQPQTYQQNGYGWSHGYYYVPGGYYYPPAQTVVTVTPGVQTTTTTVTEEYVDSYVASSSKRLVKPAAKRLLKPGY